MSDIDTENVVRASFERCRRISAGVDELIPVLQAAMPLKVGDLAELTFELRTASLAYLKRYEQLQDMLARLARAIVSWEGQDAREMTNRDVGNWLEKRELVEHSRKWIAAAMLRNRLVHEYPITEQEQVERVNLSWDSMNFLRDVLARIEKLLEAQGLPK